MEVPSKVKVQKIPFTGEARCRAIGGDPAATIAPAADTLTGTMTYHGEGPIGFRGTNTGGSNYHVENQWGGNQAPWHEGGHWVLGCRPNQPIISIQMDSNDGGASFHGMMTYAGEGPIDLKLQS